MPEKYYLKGYDDMKKAIKRAVIILSAVFVTSQYGCVIAEDYSDNAGSISLDSMTVTGEGIAVDGNIINITSPGDFTVTGSADDAMIYIKTDGKVKLRLSGMSLSNSSGPAIFFDNVEKGFITVTENTENYISDGTEYEYDAKAAIFSNDDLEIKGNGTLSVTGNYDHGIASDDDIKIENSTLNITAVTDGIHVNNTFEMTGGTLNISAASDGIQAEEDVIINAGIINIQESEEGIESGTTLTINGGEINIVSTDDGLNSGGGNGMGSDGFANTGMPGGMRAERPEQMFGADAAGSADGSEEMPQAPENMPEQPQMPEDGNTPSEGFVPNGEAPERPNEIGGEARTEQGGADTGQSTENVDKSLYINGGVIRINAQGDGADSNGDFYMTGGELYIDGPSSGGDGAVDCGKFVVSGGTVIAVGSSAMAMGPSGESEQNSIMINLDNQLSAGTNIILKNSVGEEIMNYTTKKEFSSIVYTSDTLQVGESYELYADGELLQSIEMTDAQTTVGNRGFGGGRGGGMQRPDGSFGMGRQPVQSDGISIVLNGSEITTDTEPVIAEDSVLVPVRVIFEALGMEVSWDEATSSITAEKDELVITMQIGSKTAYKNGEAEELAAAPEIRDSRTLVPVRFVAESLGMQVDWNEDTRTVEINEISLN